MLKDTYRHKGLRKLLISELRTKGIKNERILEAFWHIPRHFFVAQIFEEHVYQDKAFPIDCGQTISQPLTVAIQSELMDIQKGDKVLEIGLGSGYQAAVLHYLGAKVYSIERHEKLFLQTTALLNQIGFHRVRTFHGDGMKGLDTRAPFDKILVTAGARKIPKSLLAQVKVGGYLIIPIGEEEQQMYKITRTTKTKFISENYGTFRFVPLLSGTKDALAKASVT